MNEQLKKFTRKALACANARVSADKAVVKQLEDQLAQLTVALDAARANLKKSEQSKEELLIKVAEQAEKALTLKIGRYEYVITNDDKFMDNGACVQLMTQSQEIGRFGVKTNPKLSSKAIKLINKFSRRELKTLTTGAVLFSLELGA